MTTILMHKEPAGNKVFQLSVFGGCSVVYAAMIAYGCWQDERMTVKYTDVDYWILYDAAKHLLNKQSPYDRTTFRYSPLLALPLLLDHVLGRNYLGKVVFSLVTVLIGQVLLKILVERQRMERGKAVVACLASWTLNPMVVGISTRGSSEAIVMLPILLFAWFITVQRRTLAAICLGLGVHLKLFPIVYLPSVLVFYGLLPWAVSRHRGSISGENATLSVLSTPMKPPRSTITTTTTVTCISSSLVHLKKRHVAFTVLTIGTAVLLFLGVFYAYGWKGIEESLLYHLTRKDHRHNFSPFFALFHNSDASNDNNISRILLFIPQVLMMLAVSVRFGKVDLPFACFLQTWLFVSFNRVITSQVLTIILIMVVLCVVPLLATIMHKLLEHKRQGMDGTGGDMARSPGRMAQYRVSPRVQGGSGV